MQTLLGKAKLIHSTSNVKIFEKLTKTSDLTKKDVTFFTRKTRENP
jgi:hypothetical protein